MTTLQVALDAQVGNGTSGGIQQFAIGLVHGLASLPDSEEEYLLLTLEDGEEWLQPYASDAFHFLPRPEAEPLSSHAIKTWVRTRAPWLRRLWWRIPRGSHVLNASDGRAERNGAEVLHFTNQAAFRTTLPNIYQPHDLQFVHLPQFYSVEERIHRDRSYRAAIEQASLVAASSTWVKHDLIEHYGIDEKRVAVVPPAPLLNVYPTPTAKDLDAVRIAHRLPQRFILYPAQTWPHKNHAGLLQAVAHLWETCGERVHVVFSGKRNDHAKELDILISQLGIGEQITFTGFISDVELQCLYTLARAVVIPTKFEAASFPLWEAFEAGVPAACSNVTSLPKQAGDAALVFDPSEKEEIANAVHLLWNDDELCRDLAAKGRTSVSRFSWELTAGVFRAYYRLLAGRKLSDKDQFLLDTPPLL